MMVYTRQESKYRKRKFLYIEGDTMSLAKKYQNMYNLELAWPSSFDALIDDFIYYKPAGVIYASHVDVKDVLTVLASLPGRQIIVTKTGVFDSQFLTIHKNPAEMILILKDMYGLDSKTIADVLYSMGFRTSSGKKFTQNTVRWWLYKSKGSDTSEADRNNIQNTAEGYDWELEESQG